MNALKMLIQGLQIVSPSEFIALEFKMVELIFPNKDYSPFLALSRNNKDVYYLDFHLGREEGTEYRVLYPIGLKEKDIFLSHVYAYISIMDSPRDMFLITINQYSGNWMATYHLPKDYDIKKFLRR